MGPTEHANGARDVGDTADNVAITVGYRAVGLGFWFPELPTIEHNQHCLDDKVELVHEAPYDGEGDGIGVLQLVAQQGLHPNIVRASVEAEVVVRQPPRGCLDCALFPSRAASNMQYSSRNETVERYST